MSPRDLTTEDTTTNTNTMVLKSLDSDLSLTSTELGSEPSDLSESPKPANRIPDHLPTKLTWGTIQIREYNRIVGDHPDTFVGPPLTFDWEYSEQEPLDITLYEESRAPKKTYLRLSSITRKNLLKNKFDIDERTIAASEKEVQRIRKRREATVKQVQRTTSLKKAVKRTFSGERFAKALTSVAGGFAGMTMAHA